MAADWSEQEFQRRFSSVIDEKLPLFRAIAFRIVNSAADADDAVQTALWNAWRRRASFQNADALTSWIGRIVVNEAYELLRRRRREERKREQYRPEEPAGETEARLRQLEAIVARLPEGYRQTVQIALFSGLETGEAARMLHCSVNTLYQRIFKARRLIREAFEREVGDDE